MAGKWGRRGCAGALRPALAAALMACLAPEAMAFAWSPQSAALLGSQRAVPLCRCAASIPGPLGACTCGRPGKPARAPVRAADGRERTRRRARGASGGARPAGPAAGTPPQRRGAPVQGAPAGPVRLTGGSPCACRFGRATATSRAQARRVLNMVGTMDEEMPALSGPPKLAAPPVAAPAPVEAAPAPVEAAPAPAQQKAATPETSGAYANELSWTSTKKGAAPSDCLYTACGKCKAVYVVTEAMIGDGTRIQCSVCENVWYQAPERLKEMTEGTSFRSYDVEAWKRDEELDPRRARRGGGGGGGGQRGKKGAVTLFVGNLPFSTTEDTLRDRFEVYGDLTQVSVITDADGRPRGFAFVDFEVKADGEQACREMNGFSIDGRNIDVKVSEDRGGGGGRGGRGGGRGGRGGRGGGRGGGGDGRDSSGKFTVRRAS